jgi:hypothetical protein
LEQLQQEEEEEQEEEQQEEEQQQEEQQQEEQLQQEQESFSSLTHLQERCGTCFGSQEKDQMPMHT